MTAMSDPRMRDCWPTDGRRRDAGLRRRGASRGLSDRAIAWLFIAPTIVLLLAINIFPLIWTIQLSFTNYRANRPNAPRRECRARSTTSDILTDPDVWAAMQVDGAFRLLDDPAPDRARLRARLADRPQVPRPRLLDDDDPDADDAVAGRGRQFLDASSTSRRSACSTTSSPSSPASRPRPSRCSAT